MTEFRGVLPRILQRCGLKEGETFSLAAIKDRSIRPTCHVFDDTGIQCAEAWLRAMTDWNLYVCGNPLKPGTQGKPKADDVTQGRVMLLDADPDPSEEATADAAWKVHNFCYKNDIESHVVDSGRGTQVWVRTDPILSPSDRQVVGKFLAITGAVPGAKFDGTFNVDRLMRLPGSVNLKTGREAKFLTQ